MTDDEIIKGLRNTEWWHHDCELRMLAAERIHTLIAEVARLRAAIKAVIDGDYPNPRDHRPGNCKHGVFYWEDCHQCIDEFLTAALATEGTT